MAQKPKKTASGKSWKRRRREAYFAFGEDRFREAVYDLAKSLQAQGTAIPHALQDYVDHVDAVRRSIPKPPPIMKTKR